MSRALRSIFVTQGPEREPTCPPAHPAEPLWKRDWFHPETTIYCRQTAFCPDSVLLPGFGHVLFTHCPPALKRPLTVPRSHPAFKCCASKLCNLQKAYRLPCIPCFTEAARGLSNIPSNNPRHLKNSNPVHGRLLTGQTRHRLSGAPYPTTPPGRRRRDVLTAGCYTPATF